MDKCSFGEHGQNLKAAGWGREGKGVGRVPLGNMVTDQGVCRRYPSSCILGKCTLIYLEEVNPLQPW